MCNSINGSSNGAGGGGDEWDPFPKKQRNHHHDQHQQQQQQNHKPRQRGLGVAKLEKILREQKDKEENKVAVAEFSSRLISAVPRQYHHRPPSSAAMAAPFTAPPLLYGHAGVNSSCGVGGRGVFAQPAAAAGGSGGGGCLRWEGPQRDHPRTESNRINTAPAPAPAPAHAPLILQREHRHQQHPCPSPTMNPSSCPMSAAWSTSYSAGRDHQIEHPSNQRPYADYYNSFIIRPEEQKIAGTKRLWPFSNDHQSSELYYSPPPPPPPPPPPFPADTQKALYQSPSSGSAGAIMLEPAGKTVLTREANTSSLIMNSRKCFPDSSSSSSSSDGNFLRLGLPGAPNQPRPTSKTDFPYVNLLPLLGCMGGGHQERSADSKPGGSIHDHHRPSTSLSLNYVQIDEAEEDDIDLNLKL